MLRIGLQGFTRLRKGIALAKPWGLGSRSAPLRYMCTEDNARLAAEERETIEYDVVIVGGGPAGLATAIKLKQLEEKHGAPLDVCIIEKGSEIGSHILSGNCFEPKYFEELFPNWAEMENPPPLNQKVTSDAFRILGGQSGSFKVPNLFLPKSLDNHGNYIVSLGELSNWMGEQAEELGVDIFAGFSADELLWNDRKQVTGIVTADMGIGKDGQRKGNFQAGMNIKAKQVVLAEGCRGSLSERVISEFNLRKNCDPQSYGIGLKEVWQVPEENMVPGLVEHTVGWPLESNVYAGSFMYHMGPNLIHLGLVLGLDYKNPYLNPYEEFQKWKTHESVKKYLKNGTCLKYGARALNEGGFFSIPRLTFPGGVMVGCSAGFLDISKIKGSHNAIKSGAVAAESLYEKMALAEYFPEEGAEVRSYEDNLKKTDVWSSLHSTRNFKGGFKAGLWGGLTQGAVVSFITKGREGWNLRNSGTDSSKTEPASKFTERQYPKADGKLTFDLLENLQRSGTFHDHDQPSHLKIKTGKEEVSQKSLKEYAGLEARFCPAKVYEFVENENGEKTLQINAQNCIHCKTCSIKMVDEYIDWNVPQGAEGPNYTSM